MSLSKRTELITPSPTLAISAKAKAMKAEGIDVVGFGAGEPDFDTPDHIKEAAKKSIDDGFTKYTPASGTKELKESVCKKLKKDNGLDYNPSQITISCGAKHTIYNAIQIICDERDEVILPSPYWVSYPEQIKLSGAKIVVAKTTEEEAFKLKPEVLKSKISDKTKLLILNSPSNPTGCVYSKEELEKIAKIAVENNIYVISDEIYEKLIYDGQKHISIASFDSKIKDLTIVVNGVSKAYSMTGWRIGYGAASKDIIDGINKLQSHSTSNPTSISQKAALAALNETQEPVKIMASEFVKRRDFIVDKLNQINGISCIKPKGAFYVFPNISKLLGKRFKDKEIDSSMTLAEILLSDANVAVVPGSPFGAEGYMRLSYATSMDNIKNGLDRIEEFASKLN